MKIDFNRNNGLVPAIVQDPETLQVLMLGYMNQEALDQTIRTGKVTFYSRSRKQIWIKGETSGNFLIFKSFTVDCDKDALLIKAIPVNVTCHNGEYSCFGESRKQGSMLYELQKILEQRKSNPCADSYSSRLLSGPVNAISQKVGEEGVELALEGVLGRKEELKEEAADLLFHTLLLLVHYEIKLEEIEEVLKLRNSAKSSTR